MTSKHIKIIGRFAKVLYKFKYIDTMMSDTNWGDFIGLLMEYWKYELNDKQP